MIALAITFIVLIGAHLFLRPLVNIAVRKPTALNGWGDLTVMALGIVSFFGAIVVGIILAIVVIIHLGAAA